MAERSVVVKVRAEVGKYKADMAAAAKATEKVGDTAEQSSTRATGAMGRLFDSAQRNEQAWSTAADSLALFGAAAVAGAGLAVAAYANFDAAMSSVQASTMESASNMELLREAAIDAGNRTKFSATEAAGAIEQLAKAGVSTADILGGGLDGALDLAAAGGIEVAEAAETAASAMTQFGLKGQDVTHIVDLLAAGAGKAQGGVKELSDALSQSGLVAAQMGVSLEGTIGSLTAFASAGLMGSDAGTSFRNMLLRLANPTAESAELMEKLGISAYDAQGNFVGMADLAGQLQGKLGGLTQETRNAYLAQLFGNDAIRAANVLYQEGEAGIREWTQAVDDQGYAAKVAAERMDNLKGDLEKLGGAFETMLIGLGSHGDGVLRGLVQGITDVITKFSELPAPIQGVSLAIVGGGGLVALGVAGLGKLVVGIANTKAALKDLNVTAGEGARKIGRFAAKAGLAVAALYALGAAGKAAQEAIYGTAAGTNELKQILADTGNYDQAFSHLTGEYNSMEEALRTLVGDGWLDKLDRGLSAVNQAVGGPLPDDVAAASEQFTAMGDILAQMVSQGDAQTAAEQFADMASKAEALGYSQEDLLSLMPAYQEALIGLADGQYDAAYAVSETTGEVDLQTTALYENMAAQAAAAGEALSLRSAQRNLQAAVDAASAAVKENGKTLDVTTEKGRKNQDALDGIARAGWDLIDSMQANGATQEELQGTMSQTRSRFIDVAQSMGLSKKEARNLADELGLIPKNVDSDVNVHTGAAQAAMAGVQSVLNEIDGTVATAMIVTTRRTIYESVRTSSRAVPYVNRALAGGGGIFGPGTETSDSIPAMLSHNEHVLSAREVRGLGGHGAVEQLRAQARGGAQGFATGGAVSPTYIHAGGGPSSMSRTTVGPTFNTEVYPQSGLALEIAETVSRRQKDALAVYTPMLAGS